MFIIIFRDVSWKPSPDESMPLIVVIGLILVAIGGIIWLVTYNPDEEKSFAEWKHGRGRR